MFKAVIFDLDGVIVSTDEFHFKAWKQLADEENIYFDHKINERLRGVSRTESLEIILEKSKKTYSAAEKLTLATRKNNYYVEMLNQQLTPADILPGVMEFISLLKKESVLLAIGSSSKNTPAILDKINLTQTFDAIADGNQIENSKPHPEVFLLAAKKLQTEPKDCLVIEDADAGIEAALNANMKVIAVNNLTNTKAHMAVNNLELITKDQLLAIYIK